MTCRAPPSRNETLRAVCGPATSVLRPLPPPSRDRRRGRRHTAAVAASGHTPTAAAAMEAMEWDGDGASSLSTDGTMDDDRGRAVGGDAGARPPVAAAGGAVADPRRVPPLPRLPLPAAAPRRAPGAAPTGAAAAATTLADLFPLAGTHDSGAYVIDAHRVSRAAATLPPLHLRWVRWALRDVLRDFSRTQYVGGLRGPGIAKHGGGGRGGEGVRRVLGFRCGMAL